MQTAIQHSTFPDGGFVLHKVTLPSCDGRFSAWYDAKGTLIDAEGIYQRGFLYTVRPVKRFAHCWQQLAVIGKRYVQPSF